MSEWLDPNQVNAWLNSHGGVLDVQEAAVDFVRAFAEGEIACEASPNDENWTAPRPGCECDSCNSVSSARLIAEALDG